MVAINTRGIFHTVWNAYFSAREQMPKPIQYSPPSVSIGFHSWTPHIYCHHECRGLSKNLSDTTGRSRRCFETQTALTSASSHLPPKGVLARLGHWGRVDSIHGYLNPQIWNPLIWDLPEHHLLRQNIRNIPC